MVHISFISVTIEMRLRE